MGAWFASAALFATLLIDASAAQAQTRAWPTRHVDRDLAVPRHTLRIDGGPRWPLPSGQVVHHLNPDWDDALWLSPGVSFGVTENLELGLQQPIQVYRDGDLADPLFHGTYQWTRGTVDAGVFWGVRIPFEGHLVTRVGVPLYVHLGRMVRLDLGGFLRMEFPEDNTTVDLEAPFLVPINVTPQLFLGPEVALVTWGGFEDVAIPAGFFLGYTVVTGGGTLGDFSGRFRDGNLRADSGAKHYELIFAADLFFDL